MPDSEPAGEFLTMIPVESEISIKEKIEIAKQLFKERRGTLEGDPFLTKCLCDLSQKIERSKRVMKELGIDAACRECDEKQGGSCCGRGLERQYGPAILLINLLLGVSLPRKRLKKDSCYFLGNRGCILKVREILCVNYLCGKIENRLALADLVRVQAVTGEEMDGTFLLHETIKKLLRKRNV